MSTQTIVRPARPFAATRSRFARHTSSPRSRPRWVSLSDGTALSRRRAISSSIFTYSSAAREASPGLVTFSPRCVTRASTPSALRRSATVSASSSVGPATKRRAKRRAPGLRSIASPIRRCVESLSRIARPRSVMRLDRVHQEAFAQTVLADPQLVDCDLIQRCHHDGRARNDQVGTAGLEARELGSLFEREPGQTFQELLDGGPAQDVPLDAIRIVVDETEIERRQRRHRARRSDEVRHAGSEDRLGQLVREPAAYVIEELAIAPGIDAPGKRKPFGQRYYAEAPADH